jgi:NAD(P)-dependent dehydrogenase (short-subunit alcohol dehydrogenase family)
MSKTVLISGASTGFGALAARALADAGHRVFAGMRDLPGHNAAATEEAVRYSQDRGAELRPVESVEQGVQRVLQDSPRLDVLVHHVGHTVTGPAEAFTPEQLAELYDVNVLGTQRLNRAVLPHMRHVQDGLLVWVGSSSTRGGTTPYLAPYFAAKAGMDALAASYALELARWGIESTIMVPGPSRTAPVTTAGSRPTRRWRPSTRRATTGCSRRSAGRWPRSSRRTPMSPPWPRRS